MKKTAGFTLIELVIVIVILGILGAVAAPRFLNLQGDAYAANVKSLAGSLQSAATLAHTKAVLESKDKTPVAATATGKDAVTGYEGVAFENGFPTADIDSKGIFGALQSAPSDNDYAFDVSKTTPPVLTIEPIARKAENVADAKCFVKYTAATSSVPAKVEYEVSGCN